MKTIKKLLILTIAMILSSAFLFTGCDSNDEDVIKIGAILPLTGELSSYGVSAKNGIDLAIEDFQDFKVEVYFEDSKGEPRTAISVFNKLINVNRVDFVIGDLLSSTSLAIAPIANQRKVLAISPTASSSEINMSGTYSLSIYPSEIQEGIAVANIAHDNKLKNIVVVYETVAATENMANSFKNELNSVSDNVKVHLEAISSSASDFRNNIARIRTINPDAVFIITYPNVAIPLIRQIKEAQLNPLLLGQSALVDDAFLGGVSNLIDQMILTGSYFSHEREDSLMIMFNEEYKKRFGLSPNMFAAQSYDSFFLGIELYKNLTEEPNFDLSSFIYNGVTGKTTFDKNNAVIKDFSILKIQNNEFVLIK